MRNRKITHITDTSLPIYDDNNNHFSAVATTRRRRLGPKQQADITIVFVASLILFASIYIITFHHVRLPSTNLVGFMANAAPLAVSNASPDITYDIAILGAGPAGLTAAIFGARAGLTVAVLGSQSGLLSETPQLENFPSYYNNEVSGENWLKTTRAQAQELGVHFALPGLMATSLEVQASQVFSIKTQLDTFYSKSVIVATGATSRRLDLPHEQDLWGKSMHNCAICDGPMYKDKTVLVIGGGDAAIDAAVYLSRQAKRVILVHRRESFDKVKAQASIRILKQTTNIDIYTPHIVTKWNISDEDDFRLIGATIKNQNSQDEQFLQCDGAFLMIGATPNTEWLSDTLLLDNNGLILLDGQKESNPSTTKTSLSGVFAAGEVSDAKYKQAITAAAAGARAALDAERWLRGNFYDAGTHYDGEKNIHVRPSRQTTWQQKENPRDDSCDLTKEECIQTIVNTFPVVVFSKPGCPYCRRALEALVITGVLNPHIIDLSLHSNSRDIQFTLAQITGGRRTVPNVFIKGKSIGGGDETVALQATGKLKSMLEEAGAIESEEPKEKVKQKDLGPPPNGDYGCDLGTEECVTKIVNQYPLVLFSLSWCPECHRIFELLAIVGIPNPHIIDLDDYKENDKVLEIRHQLLLKAKSKSVPSLFVGGESLGGFYKVNQLHQAGELVPKLQNAGLI
mmetsp:Transcript_19610/g.29097  ORF Transcript_19610/g.29097 Transcript_19610/m.29097 type:complete len:683 (-) Transcript_19610:9-2057(-)